MLNVKSRNSFPPEIPTVLCDKILGKYEKEGSSLLSIFNYKIDARVMLLTNINIADKLVNGQFGPVRRCCYYASSHEIEYIYIRFDDETVGLSHKVLNNDKFENCF